MTQEQEPTNATFRWHSPQIENRTLVLLCFSLLVSYLLSRYFLLMEGLSPAIPWSFLPKLLCFSVPIAFSVAEMDRLGNQWKPQSTICQILLGTFLSFILLLTFQNWKVWIPICLILLLISYKYWSFAEIRRLVLSIFAFVIGIATVWNFNYILAIEIGSRLQDSLLWKVDLSIYSWLWGRPITVNGLFPLIQNSIVFDLLEKSYFILIPELLIVLFLGAREGEGKASSYLLRLFSGYAVAVLWCFIFPTIGPCFEPTMMDEAYRRTQTWQLLRSVVYEFSAIYQGAPLSGYAYFIALPSMHVAGAVLLQTYLKNNSILFWVFLPINSLCILSTIVLGYHYLLDIPTGLLVTALVYVPDWLYTNKKIENDVEDIFEREALVKN